MKYLAVFLREIGQYKKKPDEKEKIENKKQGKKSSKIIRPNFIKVGEKKFSPLDESITFDSDNSYPVQLEAYSYQSKDTLIYFYDYDNMNLIGLEVLLKYGMKPKDLNKVTGKRIVEQIVAGAKQVQGNPLVYIILPLITAGVALVLGYWMGGGFNAPAT